jgi:cobalamin biosynthesis protein CobT
MINKKLIQGAQASVCAGLLGEGVKILYDVDVPCADLKNRVMHLRPMPDEVKKEDILHLKADVDHETGHFGATDPTVFDKIKDPLYKLVVNAIEDGYVERWMSDRWFGCGENLQKSNKKLRAEMKREATGKHDCVKRRAMSALTMLSFGNEMKQIYKELGEDIQIELDKIEDLIPELRKVDCTGDSLRLAGEVLDRWAWTRDKPKPKKDGKDGKDGKGKPTKGKGKGKPGKAEPEKPKEEPSLPEQEAPKPSPSPSEDKEATGGSKPEPEPEEQEEDDRPDSETLAKTLDKDSVEKRRKRKIRDTRFESARYFARTEEDEVHQLKVTTSSDQTSAFVDSVRSIVPPLRRRLLMEFRGVGSKRAFNKKRGEIDRESLHKVALGNTRIFTQDEAHPVPDADVTLLIDASGSMMIGSAGHGRTRLFLAAQAAAAFSSVLDLIGVSNECLAFTTHNGDSHSWYPEFRGHSFGGKAGLYTRVRPLRHMVIKDASESFRAARHRFASLAYFDECQENVDGESVMWAARRLAARNRSGMSPILLVFSDGDPASQPESSSLLNWHLKEVVERIEKAGIHTIGVGIATTSVERFFPKHIVLNDLSDLVGTSYRILSEVLKKARRVG